MVLSLPSLFTTLRILRAWEWLGLSQYSAVFSLSHALYFCSSPLFLMAVSAVELLSPVSSFGGLK